jgi:hypothetical protein
MAVIINEFEAVAESEGKKSDTAPAGAPPKIAPAMLRAPLHRLTARAQRLRAH